MFRNKKALVLIVFFLINISRLSLAVGANYDKLCSMHSSYTMGKGEYSVGLKLMRDGGLMGFSSVGLFDCLNIGLSYGGDNVIGSGEVGFFSEPGVQAKLKLFNEKRLVPAISLGYDSQKNSELVRAVGFYTSLSKRLYWSLGSVDLNGNFCYNPKDNDDKDFNVIGGVFYNFNNVVGVGGEYNFALDEKSDENIENGGYLNAIVKFYIFPQVELDLLVSDILNKKEDFVRELRITYYANFLKD